MGAWMGGRVAGVWAGGHGELVCGMCGLWWCGMYGRGVCGGGVGWCVVCARGGLVRGLRVGWVFVWGVLRVRSMLHAGCLVRCVATITPSHHQTASTPSRQTTMPPHTMRRPNPSSPSYPPARPFGACCIGCAGQASAGCGAGLRLPYFRPGNLRPGHTGNTTQPAPPQPATTSVGLPSSAPLPQPAHQGASNGRERWCNSFLRVLVAAVAFDPN